VNIAISKRKTVVGEFWNFLKKQWGGTSMEMFVYILIVADHHPRIKKGVAIVILNCARSILSSMNGALHMIIFNEVRSRFSFFALTLRKRRTKGQLTILNNHCLLCKQATWPAPTSSIIYFSIWKIFLIWPGRNSIDSFFRGISGSNCLSVQYNGLAFNLTR